MATRKIYTTSEVLIGGAADDAASVMGMTYQSNVPPFNLPSVTSATYTRDTPREQVSVFGKKGQVDTVQNESTTSTIEVVFHPWTSTHGLEGPEAGALDHDQLSTPATGASSGTLYQAGNVFQPIMLNALMNDAAEEVPTGETVLIKGIGKLTKSILTSITAEGSVGALPTITLGFDGNGASDTTSVTPDPAGYLIANMEDVKLLVTGAGGGNTAAYAQSATFNWEMPIEKLNKLGNSVESATSYGTPPGTSSISVEGTDDAGSIRGVTFGQWYFWMDSTSAVSNVTNSLAVGDIGGTFNTTTEGTADGCGCWVYGID